MSLLTGSQQQPSENEEPVSTTEKSAMPNPGSRIASAIHRNKTLTSHSARSSSHGDNISNTGEDGSTGNKPLSNTVRRPFGKTSVSPVSQKRMSSRLPASSLLTYENQYSIKKKRYLQLKKELLDRQKAAQDLYNETSQLYEKLSVAGAKDLGKLEEIKIAIGSNKNNLSTEAKVEIERPVLPMERLPIGKETLDFLENYMRESSMESQKFCEELLQKQSSFVAFVTSHLINASEGPKHTDDANSSVTLQLEVHQRDCDVLRSRLEDVTESKEKSVVEVIKNVSNMIEEFENSRIKLYEMNAVDTQKELQIQLHHTREELQAEKEKNLQSKDRLRQMEMQVQRARTKIKELEVHVENDEGKMQQLQATIKTLEGQVKQKEGAMENKMKDMQKVMKNSECLLMKVQKQRDSFETRLVELKEQMTVKENNELMRINELSERLKAATTEVGVEKGKRIEVEEAYTDLQDRYRYLEEKSKQLCELGQKGNDYTIIEGNHSENEVRLFNELQTTRAELEAQRQMMLQLQQEKEEIVAVMHQAANSEEAKDSREKLAADLVVKSTELQNLMMEYAELKKIAKNAQEKNGILERQLAEIQTQLRSQSMEGGSAGLSAHAIELQQQISDLRNNLAEEIQQKEELKTALTQKQLELEQIDHVMREQGKFLKVRDELLDILKGKFKSLQQENGELSNSEENNEYLEQVHKQITAKTEALQELYTTLKNKQLQIMHLEKMVKLMEVQQDRAQAQRTRLENRIAQLELTIHRSKEQRYVRNNPSHLRFHVDNEPDKLSQDYYSETDQSALRHFYDLPSLHRNHYNTVARESNFVYDTEHPQTDRQPIHNYEYYTSRQTSSSDDDQGYVCERCRQEEFVEKDQDSLFNKNNFNDSAHEFFLSSQEAIQDTENPRDFQNDNYFRDSPSVVKDRKYTSMILSGESENVDDSSRESQYSYHRGYRYFIPQNHTRSLLVNRPDPREIIF